VKLAFVSLFIAGTVGLTSGCEPAAPLVQSPASEVSAPGTVLTPPASQKFQVAATADLLGAVPTVKALMRDSINPAARGLWSAVSYVATAEGEQETMPTTDEDWQRLQTQVDTLLKAGLSLKLPNLTVDDSNSAAADYQYPTADIAALLATMPTAWRNYSERMQAVSLQIADSIKRHDVQTFTELGATLNQACEGCHAEYWYRPLAE
jgi:hypothetical protein